MAKWQNIQKIVENLISQCPMIHELTFSNFFSFRDETTLSFRMNGNAHVDDSSFESVAMPGTRLSKVMAVVGPNASGKTNLLKPLAFLAWFISRSFQFEPTGLLWIRPHFLSQDRPVSTFELDFEMNGTLYRYALSISPMRVHSETLKRQTSTKFSTIFNRTWSDDHSKYEVTQHQFGMDQNQAEFARGNASLISTAAQFGVPIALTLVRYFMSVIANVNNLGRPIVRAIVEVDDAASLFAQSEPLRKDLAELLRSWDLGLTDVIYKELPSVPTRPTGERRFTPAAVHKFQDNNVVTDFDDESSGTQAAFVLLSKLLPALHLGGVAVIDELEADLHPLMLDPIVHLFISPRQNPNNAQLLFTTHSVEILNSLQKAQVTLVEKNENGVSQAWSLSDVRGVRNDENFFGKYLAGAYGAVPSL
jgi:AAA15 family ATPase/GTPase